MPNIEYYQLYEEASPDNLSDAVTEAIDDGLQPFGSPFYSPEKGGRYCQAIVRYAEENQ